MNCTSGDVRLAGGDYYYGRVEVCIGGIFGGVCLDNYWDNVDASVVCGQLGFSPYGLHCPSFTMVIRFITGSLAVNNWWNGEEGGITFITGLNCSGTEQHILDCPVVDEAPVCSSDYADANVICQGTDFFCLFLIIKINLVHGSVYSNCSDGEVRLFGGTTKYEGTVEVCLNSAWMTISGYYTYSNNYLPTVLCNSLGYNFSGIINVLQLLNFCNRCCLFLWSSFW